MGTMYVVASLTFLQSAREPPSTMRSFDVGTYIRLGFSGVTGDVPLMRDDVK